MNIFIDKNYPKNGNNYSKETIKSIYNQYFGKFLPKN